MKGTTLFIKFTLMISILLLTSNTIVCKSSLNNKQVMIVGKVIGLNSNIDILESDETISGMVQTSKQNIGIMTCIDLENDKYVAFCHGITKSNKVIEINNGECYATDFISIERPGNYSSGSIKATANCNIQYGDITKNTDYGIYGNITSVSEFNEKEDNIYSIASRIQIEKGKAQIYIDLDGNGLKSYDIEITGIDYLKQNQNLHIKVIDENLIDITGGIVKGMSGTPIIQNGKFIGAINYVSESNPTDAYGIFADKLFE